MRKRIRDLNFDEIIAKIAQATHRQQRLACTSVLQADLAFVKSKADAVELLCSHVTLAALRHAQTLDDVRFEQPLIQALVRIQHHPLAGPIPRVGVQHGLDGPDAGPRLREIVAAHRELSWDADAIQELIIREIRELYGAHELDDAELPWNMYWSPASAAAYALIVLVTLRTLGDI